MRTQTPEGMPAIADGERIWQGLHFCINECTINGQDMMMLTYIFCEGHVGLLPPVYIGNYINTYKLKFPDRAPRWGCYFYIDIIDTSPYYQTTDGLHV